MKGIDNTEICEELLIKN